MPEGGVCVSLVLSHRTSYQFEQEAQLGPHLIRLRPQCGARALISDYRMRLAGTANTVYWQQDAPGNLIARAIFPDAARRLDIHVRLTVDPVPVNPFDFFLPSEAEHWPVTYSPSERTNLAAYFDPAPAGPRFSDFLNGLPKSGEDTVGFLVALNKAVGQAVSHVRRYEQGTLDPETVLKAGQGACRDSSWLLVEALRHRGFAARFVSGYLLKLHERNNLRAGLHAWAEVFVPGAGWIGLDPSKGLLAGETHIPLAAAPHWRGAAPVTGSSSVAGELDHEMRLDFA